MSRMILVSALVCSLASGFVVTVARGEDAGRPAAQAGLSERAPDRDLMQAINDAWTTLDPDSAAKYYDKASFDVFYDVAPLKYTGWLDYARGARETLETLRSMKYTVGEDAVVHIAGDFAWGTATLRLETVGKDGLAQTMDLRWTPIWEKKGGQWLIVHEHLSAPLGAAD